MSTRKPQLPLIYVDEQPALWLQAVTATPDRNAGALCRRQWKDSAVQLRSAGRGHLH